MMNAPTAADEPDSTPAHAGDPSGQEGDEDADRSPEQRGGPSSHHRKRGGGLLDYGITIVVALVIAVLVKTFLVQPFYIPSASMHPTLFENDKILVSKLHPGVFDLERGDVVVFEDPGQWAPITTDPSSGSFRVQKVLSLVGLVPDPGQSYLVKRLIGLPGDHVVCPEQGGDLEVNGKTLDEPYINPETPPCQAAFDVTVPAGKIWVMGDNRYASADSAWHESHGENGFVPEENITGRALFVFWPVDRWRGLGSGEQTFSDVPDPS